MSEFEEIDSMKVGDEKKEKLLSYYKDKVKIESWLNNDFKNWKISFKDHTVYKKNKQYHRLNGPAIDYNDEKLDEYYYKGVKYEHDEWKKITTKELRKIKIKRLNQQNQ